MGDTDAAYDASAHTYDARYRDIQYAKYAFALSLAGGSMEGDILDVGCGTGLFGLYLGRAVYGVDSSQGMLTHARGRLRATHADACDLPFSDNSFDWVVSFTVLQNITAYDQALSEIARVLRPGGRCILTYLDKPPFEAIGCAITVRFRVLETAHHGEDCFFFATTLPDGGEGP
ncbi:MAG: class I SAM-dependent methyltransferase [Candidatus Methanofastidiosa archaeon]|nr:class I SAM-dependent methyltransferase [Candidatus Methanofastidiosa archaeon]